MIPVTLESTPSGADVYVVPLTDWHGNGGEALLATPEKLNPYRQGELTTPAEIELPPKKLVLVAVRQDAGATASSSGMSGYKFVVPKENAKYAVTLKAR